MARASAEGNVEFFPVAQSPLRFLADVAHSGNSPVVPRGHASFENWSRSQLQQYLNYRIGGINKYANYSRSRLIQRLLLIETGPGKRKSPVSRKERIKEKSSPAPTAAVEALLHPSPATETPFQTLRKRSRKGEKIRCLPPLDEDGVQDRLCGNAACRARLRAKEEFCRRCSCCICKRFDDNKDPCLWIECGGEKEKSQKCGSSCHLECALKLGAAGVVKRGNTFQLDGSFCCVTCGFISGVLGCWKKLLSVAKDARRIDVFTTRLSLAFRLLDGTSRYQNLHYMVADAVKDLEKELRPGGLAAAMRSRGLVTRLSCGARIQDQIGNAMKKASSWPVEQEKQMSFVTKGGALERIYKTHIELATPDSAVVSWSGTENTLGDEVIGHSVWCRAAAANRFPEGPVCSVQGGEVTKAVVTGLHPGVDYELRLVPWTGSGEFGRVEARFSTPRLDHDLEPFHTLLDGEKGDLSFRIREIGKLFHGSTTATTMTNTTRLSGQDLQGLASGELFFEPMEETTSVEEEKHVISETVPSSPKGNDFQGSKSVEKGLLCTEDMDEVLKNVQDRERSELNRSSSRVLDKENLTLHHSKQRDNPGMECSNEQKERIQQHDVVDVEIQKKMDRQHIPMIENVIEQNHHVVDNSTEQQKTIMLVADDVDEHKKTIQLENHLVVESEKKNMEQEQQQQDTQKTMEPQNDQVIEENLQNHEVIEETMEEQHALVVEEKIQPQNHHFIEKNTEMVEKVIEQDTNMIQPQNHLVGDEVTPVVEKAIERNKDVQQQKQDHIVVDEAIEKEKNQIGGQHQSGVLESQEHSAEKEKSHLREQHRNGVVVAEKEKDIPLAVQHGNANKITRQHKPVNSNRKTIGPPQKLAKAMTITRAQTRQQQQQQPVILNQQDHTRHHTRKRKKITDDHLPLVEHRNDVGEEGGGLDSGDFWTEAYLDKSLEFSIKVIVWLERQGHLQPAFRLKLLTWLGFRASVEEKKMIFVYVRTLLTDPLGLAHQLVDTFGEIVATQRLRAQEAS